MMYGSENNPISPSAREKIKEVVARHEGMRIDMGWSALDAEERQAIILDLEWCYCFNPLDLDKMLSCEADVLFADIAGIVAQLDRQTGALKGFQPQCWIED